MIPMELMSMLGSTVLGGVMSIMAQKAQAQADREKEQNLLVNKPIKQEQFQTLTLSTQGDG